MNTSSLLQSKWSRKGFTLTLHEIMNISGLLQTKKYFLIKELKQFCI